MEKIKRILSIMLVCIMTVALVPVISPVEVSAATSSATGTTELFNGNATYLLQERFNLYFVNEANGGEANATLSGWDVDYRGGKVTSTAGVATLTDTKGFDKTAISHQLMKHTGDNLVMESAFQYSGGMDSGFHYTLSGEGKVALDLTVNGDQNGYYFYANGTKTEVACSIDTFYTVKAIFTTSQKKVDVYIDGVKAASVPYKEQATSIDNIEVGTTEEQIATIKLNYVYVYVNYTVNEQFMGSHVSNWDVAGGTVVAAPGSPYPADPNGYSLPTADGSVINPGNPTPINIDLPLDDKSELTWVQSGVTVSNASSIGGRNNVVMATGVADSNNNTVGVKLGSGDFAFKEGDIITYSIDYYSPSTTTAQVWLRRHGGGTYTSSLQPFRSDNHVIKSANTWTTLTKTINFSDLGGTANEAKWTDIGNYALYIRGAVGTCYLDNFNVTVTRVVPEPTDTAGVLEKKFSPLSGKQSFVWNMLVPSAGADGFKATFGGAEFSVSGGKFYLNGQEAYTYTNNVWYKIEVRTDGSTAEVLVNDVSQKSGVSASGTLDSIKFVNGASNSVIIDDIQVYKTFATSDYADYPTVDSVVTGGDYNLGMVVYPMWREGIHYGWDAISPYEDRTPYQGYYTGGSKEVADWDAKWMLEHGIDHAIYPFVNPKEGQQAKTSVRGEALDGYLASEFKDQLSYAIMLTNPLDENLKDSSDYIANAVPFIVEHHFKNPSYKKIDNKLVVYMYNVDEFASLLGGDAQLNTVLNQLDTEAKNLGYAGILFMADISSCEDDYIDNFKSKQSENYTIYKWRYTWGTDIPGSVIAGIKNDYANNSDIVASVPMGFDNTPWKSNYVDMMTPEQVKSIIASIPTNIGSNDPKIVLFTCWDEWGEGHFYAPSTQGGFGYLNAIREVVAGSAKTDEDMPSADAVKRMSVLYPEGRQALKIKDDRKIYTAAEIDASLTNLGTISLKDGARTGWFLDYYGVNRGEYGGCTANQITSNPYNYTYTINDASQASVAWNLSDLGSNLSIDLSKVSAIKINGYAENSAEMVLNFNTTAGEYVYRFSAPGEGDKVARDIILLPDDASKLAGTVKDVRFNPTAKTAVGSTFDVDSITFYSGELPVTHVYLDGDETHMVSEPVAKNGTTYIPAYQFLLNAGCYATWDKDTKKLTVEKDGITAVFQHNNKAVTVTGGDNMTLTNAPYYEDGNIYIPYDAVLDPFGYTVIQDAGDIYYYNKTTGLSYDTTDYVWDFEIDGNTDTWYPDNNTTLTLSVRDSLLHVRSRNADPVIKIKDINIPKSEVNYMSIKVKKTDVKSEGIIRLYDNNAHSSPSAGGLCYNFTVNPSDEIQTFVFKLDEDYNKSRTETFEALGANINSIRIDPMDLNTSPMSTYGSIYIDSIGFYAEDPRITDPEMVAYGFEDENMFDLTIDKIGTGYSNLLNANGTTAGDILPPVETVNGYENVMKLVPAAGVNNGLFNLTAVYYNGARVATQRVAEGDEIVKVSFWYKAYGNGTGFRFENRQGGTRDGEEFTKTDASTSEWKYFEEYLDMSKVADASRWFTLRIYRNGTTVNDGGLYVRDYKLVCLDTSKELTSYNHDDTIAVCLSTYDGTDTTNIGNMHISEHNTEDKVLRKIDSGVYPVVKSVTRNDVTKNETQKYFFYRPKDDDSDKIRCFLWDADQAPVTEVLELQRAN